MFALIGGPASERFGRKPIILSASVIFCIGAVIMGVATSKEVLLIGRIVVGAGIGFASMSVPMYIAEASPPGLEITNHKCMVTVTLI